MHFTEDPLNQSINQSAMRSAINNGFKALKEGIEASIDPHPKPKNNIPINKKCRYHTVMKPISDMLPYSHNQPVERSKL